MEDGPDTREDQALASVRWIDIVSPHLREIHREWCGLRGAHLVPHLRLYNAFLPSVPARDSVCAVFPASAAAPSFRSVGANPLRCFAGLRDGRLFTEIASVVERTALTVPFHEVRTARQPDCRRGTVGDPQRGRAFEQLLVPFADDHLRVCLVHAVFDLAPAR
jgi:hypothetical protein